MQWGKLAVTGTVALASLGAGDAAILNEKPVQAEYQLSERVVVEQKGNVVEAALPWKGERGLTVKYDMGEPTVAEKMKDKRKSEVITEQVEYGDGGFKMDVLLHEKPDTKRFCYTIEGWEDYDFFYQPALTPEEIAEGAERPEEIVGSYAVYHKTLKNYIVGQTNYETGKVAHIPYPYIWSVNDESTKHRAEAFSIENGEMCVTVAQSDLNTMEYPVRVDPTFGYTSIGATNTSLSSDSGVTAFNLSVNADITQISAGMYSGAASGESFKGIIYDDDGGSEPPGTLIAVGASVDNTDTSTSAAGASFQHSTISASIASGDWYIGVVTNSAQGIARDAETGFNTEIDATGNFASPENPWGASTNVADARLSVYATYTASGGGSPAPAQDVIFFE